MSIPVQRMDYQFKPDAKRIIARFFLFGGEERRVALIQRVLDLDESSCQTILDGILADFSSRHRNISSILLKHFDQVQHTVASMEFEPDPLPIEKKLLIGAYFTKEFSIESAAFFNPSMVEAPDQSGLNEGERRVITSFRATGEGHISSIVFRSGVIKDDHHLTFDPPGRLLDLPDEVHIQRYEKGSFAEKLTEMDVDPSLIQRVMEQLSDEFTYQQLQSSIHKTIQDESLDAAQRKVIEEFSWLARSYYTILFSPETDISERVIFPISDAESNGIEDARFVQFHDDDGECTYYATYTAFNGITILPKLLETQDFVRFKVMPLYGEYAKNKGLALFPRKINGRYAMVSRVDGTNNYIMFSDDVHTWREAVKVQEPRYPWQFVQIGNCGSPLETDRGWLLLTHGVGPMRTYCLGATLLDREDPTRILAQTTEPILVPNAQEREGYVPNVLYSCGGLVHRDQLIIPYAMADYASSVAHVALSDLFSHME